jgi:hypothetical protein
MTIYLQLNGTTDYIQLPSMTLDRIVIDFKPGSLTKANEYILGDNRSGYIRNNGTTGNEEKLNYSFTVGGVASTGSNNLVLPNTRCTLDATRSSTTPSVKIGSDVSGLNNLNGAFYDIKVYSSGAIVAHYDLSNGTVQDISGNGRHATLTGGTWVDDGGGTTPTDATITGIIANVRPIH